MDDDYLLQLLSAAFMDPEIGLLVVLIDPKTFEGSWPLLWEAAVRRFSSSLRVRLTLEVLKEAYEHDAQRGPDEPREFPQQPQRILVREAMRLLTQTVALAEGRRIGMQDEGIVNNMNPYGNVHRPQHDAQFASFDDMWTALLRGYLPEVVRTALYGIPHLRRRSLLRLCLVRASDAEKSKLELGDAERHMIDSGALERPGFKLEGLDEENLDLEDAEPAVDPADVQVAVYFQSRQELIKSQAGDASQDPVWADDPFVPAAVLLPGGNLAQRDAASNLLSQDKFKAMASFVRMVHFAEPQFRAKALEARARLTAFYPPQAHANGWPPACLPFQQLYEETLAEGRATSSAAWVMLSRLAFLFHGPRGVGVLRLLCEKLPVGLRADERYNHLLSKLIASFAGIDRAVAVHDAECLNFFVRHATAAGDALWCLLMLAPIYENAPPTLQSFAKFIYDQESDAESHADNEVVDSMVRYWFVATGVPLRLVPKLRSISGLARLIAAAIAAAAVIVAQAAPAGAHR